MAFPSSSVLALFNGTGKWQIEQLGVRRAASGLSYILCLLGRNRLMASIYPARQAVCPLAYKRDKFCGGRKHNIHPPSWASLRRLWERRLLSPLVVRYAES